MDTLYVVVKLMDNGDAKVVTRSHVTADQESSECFIPLTVPDGCMVEDYRVSRDNENYYLKNSSVWDTRWSRYDKLNKCAIEKKDDNHYILHWGLAENGYRVFYISYTITNLLRSFSDADGFLHEFISPDVYPLPQFAEVIVYGDNDVQFTPENARTWGRGFYGKTMVSDNHNILAFSFRPFGKDNHMTIAARIDKGLFTPELVTKASFSQLVKSLPPLSSLESRDGDSTHNAQHPTPDTQHPTPSNAFIIAIALAGLLCTAVLIAIVVFVFRKLRK
ncbi:MAG: DUF2207 domain-containing protein [Prevotella sp.]|nr:DUF2207 domain-containing protein [Prevotella sp.]